MKDSTSTIVAAIIGSFAVLGAAFIGLYQKEDPKEVQEQVQVHNKTSPVYQAGRDIINITPPQILSPPPPTQIEKKLPEIERQEEISKFPSNPINESKSNTIENEGNEKIIGTNESSTIEKEAVKNALDCNALTSPQEVQTCFKKIISKGDRFEIDNEIKKALNTSSNTFRSIALKAYLAIQPELKLAFTAPEREMEILKEYIDNPTRDNKHEMLRSRRYLLFLNASNFQHVFSISKFDMDSGKGQLREIGRGRETPHNFQVIGTEFWFNTPWCLDKKLNCKCRYDLKLKEDKLEGDTVCTGYFGFQPLKVEHRLLLN